MLVRSGYVPFMPYAVVTGASSGIGRELATQFARNHYDLVLAAEDAELHAVAQELRAEHAVEVDAQVVDLATAEGVDQLAAAAAAHEIDALAVNAGVGVGGPFVDTDLEDELRLIALNVTGAVRLTKRLLPAMAARRTGRVLFTSSQAGTMPAPYEAVYGASKAFLYQFSESLRQELKDSGVTVTALLPGPTETNFFRRAGMMDTRAGTMKHKDDAATVARQGYEALMAGKDTALGGNPLTKAATVLNKVTPDVVKAKMHAVLSKPGSAGTQLGRGHADAVRRTASATTSSSDPLRAATARCRSAPVPATRTSSTAARTRSRSPVLSSAPSRSSSSSPTTSAAGRACARTASTSVSDTPLAAARQAATRRTSTRTSSDPGSPPRTAVSTSARARAATRAACSSDGVTSATRTSTVG